MTSTPTRTPQSPPAPHQPSPQHGAQGSLQEGLQHRLQAAIDFTVAHETPWGRDNSDNWGIHVEDPPPWNRLLGPVHPRGPVSGVIRVGGQQVAAWGEPDRVDLTFSIAKTYLALLAGVAFDHGLLTDLNEPVRVKINGAGFDSAHNGHVTWLHLLQQTSEWEGDCFGVPDQVDRYRHLQYQPDRAKPLAVKKGDARPLHTPGTFWEYNDVRINQFSLALLHLFQRPLPDVFREFIAGPVGASDTWRWVGYDNSWLALNGQRVQSVPGGTHWGGGMSISSVDQGLIGQMLLNKGRANGKQVLSEAWVQRLQTPCAIAPWYGCLVWRNPAQSVFPGASARSTFAIGAGASVVWVDPDRDVVAVVRWIDGSQINGFCERVSAAIPTVTGALV
jgi:CubicO group peptidase (beta-lactamase class C family)